MIDFKFSKFSVKKFQMIITFDGELRMTCSKNESCSRWGNKDVGFPKGGLGLWNFQNVIVYY